MAGNKEIEVEDFATIAQTNNILGSSIGGGGGILIQSGLSNFNTGSMTATVSYPKTFPTKCCVVQLTPNNYYGYWSKGDVLTIKSFTNSSCTVELVGTPPVNTRSEFFWLAIGY